jgi:hypothetical protein
MAGDWEGPMGKLIGLAIGLCLISLQAADAGTLKRFKVGSWDSGAYSDGTRGKFTHCAGSAKYDSGIIVTLIINKEYNWGVAFSHPAWNLTQGMDIDLAYVVDGGEARKTTAKAVSNKQALIGFGGSTDRFKEFSRGYVLKVAAADQLFTFNLTDTSKLLPALLSCVTQQLNPTPVLASSANPAPTPAVQRPDFKAEATVIAANLLSQAGVTGFRIATADELPELKADAVWVAADIIGTINVFPTIATKDLDEVRSIIIGGDAKTCKGTFFSGSIPDDGKDNQLTRVFTTCQVKETSTSYYLAVPRKAGGVYILRTMTTAGSEKPAKEADASIRKAVFSAVPK